MVWIWAIQPKLTILLLGRQGRQSYRTEIPATILLYSNSGALCVEVHSLLPFYRANNANGSITDCNIFRDKSNTLDGNYMP